MQYSLNVIFISLLVRLQFCAAFGRFHLAVNNISIDCRVSGLMLIEDLREGILLPKRGPPRVKGLEMGVKGSDGRYRNNDDALVRRHFLWRI